MIAHYHAQAIAATQGGRLVGVATRNAENGRAFAAKHAVPFVTTSVAELVARPDIDVVCITTPSGAHLEPALAAVRAGKHLVVEKPIEITVERTDELLRAADAAGRAGHERRAACEIDVHGLVAHSAGPLAASGRR